MATKVTAMPGTEPGTYRFKATFGGGALAAFARCQGPGRDRHRREQARHHGAEVTRPLAASLAAALIAAAGIACDLSCLRDVRPDAAGFVDDMLVVLKGFAAMSGAYCSSRMGKIAWMDFVDDLHRKKAISISPKHVW